MDTHSVGLVSAVSIILGIILTVLILIRFVKRSLYLAFVILYMSNEFWIYILLNLMLRYSGETIQYPRI